MLENHCSPKSRFKIIKIEFESKSFYKIRIEKNTNQNLLKNLNRNCFYVRIRIDILHFDPQLTLSGMFIYSPEDVIMSYTTKR